MNRTDANQILSCSCRWGVGDVMTPRAPRLALPLTTNVMPILSVSSVIGIQSTARAVNHLEALVTAKLLANPLALQVQRVTL